MGRLGDLFNRIFGKKEKPEMLAAPMDKMSSGMLQDGRQFFEYYNPEPKKDWKDCDTTRVVLNQSPRSVIDGISYYEGLVSWSNESDTYYFDRQSRRDMYYDIVVGIDPNLMNQSPEYFRFMMKELLDKDRVCRYLQYGLMTEEEIMQARQNVSPKEAEKIVPCGRYIGAVCFNKNECCYKKRFLKDLGLLFHRAPEMVKARTENKERIEEQRQASIRDRKKQIARLEAEIAEIDGR